MACLDKSCPGCPDALLVLQATSRPLHGRRRLPGGVGLPGTQWFPAQLFFVGLGCWRSRRGFGFLRLSFFRQFGCRGGWRRRWRLVFLDLGSACWLKRRSLLFFL